MKPNLFRFATSELSQDAMLCWLAAWADPTFAAYDQSLHRLGQTFLQAIFEKHGRRAPEIVKPIEIKRQHRNIDVVLVINESIAVCIEDKVGTVEHSEQLQRYLVGLKEDGFLEDQIIPVYVQTGEQGSYRSVRAAGYAVLRRRELIAVLDAYLKQGGEDSIASDFYNYLANIEMRIDAFRAQPVSAWDWYAWQGFYSELQNHLNDGEWGYVPNPSGGFIGYWWHWYSDAESEQYLQLEQESLCFKIAVEDPAKRQDQRAKWSTRLLEAACSPNLQLIRPKRLGIGQTMTVAVLKEYRVFNGQGLLDLDATVRMLRAAAEILDRAVAKKSS